MTETNSTQKQFKFNKLFPELTQREAEIVYFYALGFSDVLISKYIKRRNQPALTTETIRFHLKNAKKKLNLDVVTELRVIFFNRVFTLKFQH